MACDNSAKTSNKDLLKNRLDFFKNLDNFIKKSYKWLRYINNVAWPLGGGILFVSLWVSYFGAENYIKSQHIPINVVPVFTQIIPILLFNITVITMYFAITLAIPLIIDWIMNFIILLSNDSLVLNKKETIIKYIIFPVILCLSNVVVLCIVYHFKQLFSNQAILLLIVPVVVFVICFLVFKICKFISGSFLFFIVSAIYICSQQSGLWFFWIKVIESLAGNNENIVISLLQLYIFLVFFHIIIGLLYVHYMDQKRRPYFVSLLFIVLLAIGFTWWQSNVLTEDLIKNLLEVRAPDGKLCVTLYQEKILDKSCEGIQKDKTSSNFFSSYKIGGSNRLRIPLEADGIFYVGQFEDAVKGQDGKPISDVHPVSDIHLVPISKSTMICGCPERSSTTQPAASTPQPASSAPQPTVSEPQSAGSTPQPTSPVPEPTPSTPQPTASEPQSTASTPQPAVQHPPRQQRRYHRKKSYRCR
jgi:hypothetical protein